MVRSVSIRIEAFPGIPHLHYQLQAGPGLFRHDGLPATFKNLSFWGPLGRGTRVYRPKRGYFLLATETE